ncbi:MAG: hypothetical protein HON90_05685 [Halobacteriovoraceae bacterium]|jgi:chorismate mutase|nr:hypothetical protein [Halobacteriovoraceae bacterium]
MTDHFKLLRSKLAKINETWFELLSTRQNIVSQIQELKISNEIEIIWDPKQEKDVFTQYVLDHPRADIKQDLAYSLIIELHAAQTRSYPAWSEGEHLNSLSADRNALMNPILLFIRNRTEYSQLNIKKEYQEIINNIFGENNET